MNHTRELLGKRIREIRKARGLTQERFAEMVDIEQKHVSRIELGKNYPTIDRLEKMAAALNVSLVNFFEFRHLTDDIERAESIEEMLSELNEDSRKVAYKLIKAIINTLKHIRKEKFTKHNITTQISGGFYL